MRRRAYGLCRECSRLYTLNADGSIRQHHDELPGEEGGGICVGSFAAPTFDNEETANG